MIRDKLDEHQATVADLALRRKCFAVFAEQRTGKTWMALAVIEALCTDSFLGLLVVPLTNKLSTWKKTIEEQLPQLAVDLDWEEHKRNRKQPGPRVLLVHYELFCSLRTKLKRPLWTFIGIDESQRLKDRGSVSSRAAASLRDRAEYKLILSGTPVEQAPQDVWAQFRFVVPKVFGAKWKKFERRFLYKTGYMGHKRKFKKSKLKEFLNKIEPHAIRISKEEVGIIPPEFIRCPVQLEGKQAKLYRKMEQDWVMTVESTKIRAEFAMTQQIKLHQICGGFIFDGDQNVHRVGRAKELRVLSILRRYEGIAVIFCRYKPELLRLREVLSTRYDRVEMLWGKVKDTRKNKHRTRLLEEFQAGEIDILLCQTRTGGVGIDLFEADYAIVYSTTHSYIDFDQLGARLNHRDRKDAARVFLVYACGTVDEDIYDNLEDKSRVIKPIMRQLQNKSYKTIDPAQSPSIMQDISRTRKQRNSSMGKKTKKVSSSKKAAASKKDKSAETPPTKFTINDLAEALGLSPASVRVKLRNADIPRGGKSYGWSSKAAMDEVATKLGKSKKSKKTGADSQVAA